MNNLSNDVTISDDMFLGAFDADGGHLIEIDSYLRSSGGQPCNIRVRYVFGQSNSKLDLVKKMADKFGGSVVTDKDNTEWRVGVNNEVGKKVRLFFKNNKPIYPAHLYDYLLSEEVLALKDTNAHLTKQGLVTLVSLAYKNHRNLITCTIKNPIDFWFGHINPSPLELANGLKEADLALERVNKEVSLLKTKLPTMTLTDDYIRGAHVGDGGLTVVLTWKPSPTQKTDRLRCEPEWTISGENQAYCEAFVNTLGGNVNSSGPNCRKFRLTGIEKCKRIFPLFENTWLPDYKALQFSKFKEAVNMLIAQKHFTEEGIEALVDLVYDMSEKGTRQYTKAEYIAWGKAWVKRKAFRNQI